MQIVVTFALENEFGPWRGLRKFRATRQGDVQTYVTEIAGSEVGVLLTGIGSSVAKRKVAGRLHGDSDSVVCCISSGFAGGLRPEYRIGDVLAAHSVSGGFPMENEQGKMLASSGALVSLASECGAVPVETFYTARQIVSRAEEKKWLGERADAVEMESFEVLREARREGIPAVAVRAVSDIASQDLPLDMGSVITDDGQVSMPRVLAQVAKRPQLTSELVRLAQDSHRAATALCNFLDCYVSKLAESLHSLEPGAAHYR